MVSGGKKVFIAPSVFVAFVDRTHEKYQQGAAFFRFFAENQYRLFTDIVTIDEAAAKITADLSPTLSMDFMRALMISNINLIYPEEADVKAALKALVNYRSTELSFQEALMSVLANKRDIPHICTFEYLHSLFGLSVFYLPI